MVYIQLQGLHVCSLAVQVPEVLRGSSPCRLNLYCTVVNLNSTPGVIRLQVGQSHIKLKRSATSIVHTSVTLAQPCAGQRTGDQLPRHHGPFTRSSMGCADGETAAAVG